MQEQISEELYKEILKSLNIHCGKYEISIAEQAGYIKESALEKARKSLTNLKSDIYKCHSAAYIEKCIENIEKYYEQVITELQDKLNEKLYK